MPKEPTEAEKALWHLLRNKRLAGWKFKRQQQLGNYIVDFACFETRLIVEATDRSISTTTMMPGATPGCRRRVSASFGSGTMTFSRGRRVC